MLGTLLTLSWGSAVVLLISLSSPSSRNSVLGMRSQPPTHRNFHVSTQQQPRCQLGAKQS